MTHAAAAVGIGNSSAYALRRAADAAGFATAWERDPPRFRRAARRLHRTRDRRVEEPVFDRNGRCVGTRRRLDLRPAMCLLWAYRADAFARRPGPSLGSGSPLAPTPDIADAAERVGLDPAPSIRSMIEAGERDEMAAEAEKERRWRERFGD